MIKYKITKKDLLEKLDNYLNYYFKILDQKLTEGAHQHYATAHETYVKNLNKTFHFLYNTEKPDLGQITKWYKKHGFKFDKECLDSSIKAMEIAGFVSDYIKILKKFKDSDAIELWLEHGTMEFNCIAFNDEKHGEDDGTK